MFKFSQTSLNRLKGVHPRLVEVFMEAIKVSPYDFLIAQGVRTAEYQNSLYQQGRTKPGRIVTYCDGYNKKSNHQAKDDGFGYAVDIAIWNTAIKGNLDYNINKLRAVADIIKKIAKSKNLVIEWGGDWKKFKDYPHFELKKIL